MNLSLGTGVVDKIPETFHHTRIYTLLEVPLRQVPLCLLTEPVDISFVWQYLIVSGHIETFNAFSVQKRSIYTLHNAKQFKLGNLTQARSRPYLFTKLFYETTINESTKYQNV